MLLAFAESRENRQKVSLIVLPLCQKKIKGLRIQSKVRYFGYFTLRCEEYPAQYTQLKSLSLSLFLSLFLSLLIHVALPASGIALLPALYLSF